VLNPRIDKIKESIMVERYISDYIRALQQSLERDNPNTHEAEEWDEQAISALANYYYMNDYAIYDLSTLSHIYAQYDIVKWLQASK